MAVYSWQNGIVSSNTGGPDLITNLNTVTTRPVIYVDENHANASDHPDQTGYDPNYPKASLAGAGNNGLTDGAYFSASAGDIIVIAANHTERVAITVAKAGLSIVGCGSGTSRPTLTPLSNGSPTIFTITADTVELAGLNFTDNGGASTTSTLVKLDADYVVVDDCDFKLGYIAGSSIGIDVGPTGNSTTYCRVQSCTFTDSASASATRPVSAIKISGSQANTVGFKCYDCTVNGGTYGWSGSAIKSTVAILNFWIEDLTLSSDSSLAFTHADARGIIANATVGTGCNINLQRARHYPGGLLPSSAGGADVLSAGNFYITGNVYWVSSTAGSDSNDGTERDHPFATLAAAITAFTADNGDIIVIEATHSEALASATTVSERGTRIFGLGTGSSLPTFTCTTGEVFNLSGADVWLRGIKFTAGLNSTARVRMTGVAGYVEGCYFVCGATDLTSVSFEETHGRVENNTFVISADGPDYAISCTWTDLGFNVISNNTFTGTSTGFDAAAVRFGSITNSKCLVTGNTFTGNADISIPTSNAGVTVTGNTMDDTCFIHWVT